MPAVLSRQRGRSALAALLVFALAFPTAILTGPSARAESDADALAPWQAAPGQATSVALEETAVQNQAGPANDPLDAAQSYDEPGNDWVGGQCGTTPLCDYNYFSPCDRLWVRGEYLLGWSKASPMPAMATTSIAGTSEEDAGVLGLSTTSILFGGAADAGARSGLRMTLGYWFCPCQQYGIEATYTNFSSDGVSFYQSSNASGSPILARPIRNARTGSQDSLIIAYPSVQSGSIDVRSANEMNAVEVLVREAILPDCDWRLDFLIGYRYSRFQENLSVYSPTTYISQHGQLPVGTLAEFSDQFDAVNNFHGVELGFSGKEQFRRLSLELTGKLALGRTQSQVNVNGSTLLTEPSQTPVLYSGGLLALPSNIGSYDRNSFSVIPEFGITLGYDINCRLKATLGYSVVYWSNVLRPGDQIDTDVNTSQMFGETLSGLASPTYRMVPGDFWVQSLTAGLDYRF